MRGLELDGKKVVITGAAGGIGRAFALAFAEEGASVLAADVNLPGASETVELLTSMGGKGYAEHLDVTNAASCSKLAVRALACLGGVDILINNAAMLAGIARKPFWELDSSEFDNVLNVNVKGLWQVTSALLPALRDSGCGSVINMASVTAYSGSPNWMHYVASKGAVLSMTRTMAKEVGHFNIRVNALAPGLVPTAAATDLFPDAATYGIEKLALRRQAREDDIVGGALFLASHLSAFVTGQTMIIDGGRQFI